MDTNVTTIKLSVGQSIRIDAPAVVPDMDALTAAVANHEITIQQLERNLAIFTDAGLLYDPAGECIYNVYANPDKPQEPLIPVADLQPLKRCEMLLITLQNAMESVDMDTMDTPEDWINLMRKHISVLDEAIVAKDIRIAKLEERELACKREIQSLKRQLLLSGSPINGELPR